MQVRACMCLWGATAREAGSHLGYASARAARRGSSCGSGTGAARRTGAAAGGAAAASWAPVRGQGLAASHAAKSSCAAASRRRARRCGLVQSSGAPKARRPSTLLLLTAEAAQRLPVQRAHITDDMLRMPQECRSKHVTQPGQRGDRGWEGYLARSNFVQSLFERIHHEQSRNSTQADYGHKPRNPGIPRRPSPPIVAHC